MSVNAVRGAFTARTNEGTAAIFAMTASTANKFVGAGVAWDDVTVSGGYALADNEFWSMDQTGVYLFAAAAGEPPQIIDVDSGTAFADVLGSPPQARIVRVVQDFVVLGDLSTGRNRIHWSGLQDFNSSTAWTVGTKFSDVKIFPSDGFVSGITRVGGGLGGLILLTDGVYRFQRVASRSVFEFYQMEKNQGTNSPSSIIEYAQTAYYYGLDGFQSAGPAGFGGDVGVEWIDEWFHANSNRSRLRTICGARDPKRPRYFWLFPSEGNDTTTLDRIIGYDPLLKGWFHAEVMATIIFPGAAPGVTLEGLDTLYPSGLESIPYSLDSDVWKGNVPGLYAFNEFDQLCSFSGLPMQARLQTTKFEPIKGRKFYTNGFRPIVDTGTLAGRIAVADTPAEPLTWTSEANVASAFGKISQRASGRYMQAEVRIGANAEWTHAAGIDFMDDDLVEMGER